jgi:peptidoglycan-associated lipoprotein
MKIKKMILPLSILGVFLGLTQCTSTSKKPEDTDTMAGQQAPIADEASLSASGDSDSSRAGGLETIRFPYDSSELDAEASHILEANIAILKEKAALQVQLEGHCDSRGGRQYNIALGERRANAVRRMLERAGITADRLSVISYGKENPIDKNESEEAWAKNRRVNFVLISH